MELLLSLFLAATPVAGSSPVAPVRELRGRVLSDGKPVAGATVSAVPEESAFDEGRREARFGEPLRELARGVSGRDGVFALTVPAGPSDLRLQVSAAGFTTLSVGPPLDAGAAAEVRLSRAASLAGTVLDVRGRPVAGATVTLWPRVDEPDTTTLPVAGTTGPDGRFRLDGASERGNRLRVEAPGQAVIDLQQLRAGALRQPIRLQPGRRLDGVVLRPDQKPAPGALVRLEGPVTLRWVETGPDGTFRLDGVPQTPAGSLVAEAGEAGRARALPPTTGRARLVLAPTAVLRGRAVDTVSGRPVAGVRIVVAGPGGRVSARSTADGRFELRGLTPGPSRLTADELHHAPWVLETLDVPAGGALVRDVPLVPAAVLSGRVVDENGLPVADAGGFLQGGGASQGFLRWFDAGEADFRTGPDGRFEATRLRVARNVGLKVRHPDFEERALGGLDLRPGRGNPPLEIVLRRGLALRGRVKDARGQPVADAELRLTRSFEFTGGRRGMRMELIVGGTGARRSDLRSGPEGDFEFRGLATGDYALQVRKPGYATRTLDPVKLAERGAEPLEIELVPGATISGFVRDKLGRGVEGRGVFAHEPGARGPLGGMGTDEPSAGDGAFLIEGLTPGHTYEIALLDVAGIRRGTAVVAPAEGVELLAAVPGRIEGVALDAESGLPLSDFSVSYEDREHGSRMIIRGGPRGGALEPGEKVEVHDDEGRFALEGVPAGTWDVEVGAKGYENGRAGSVTVDEDGQASGVEVRLRRGLTLAGQVVEQESGRPVADAQVEAEAQGGEMRGPRFGAEAGTQARSGLDGRFELTGLSPGSYNVTATHPDFAEAAATAQVKDRLTTVELKLGRGSRLSGVVASGGSPVSGASVALSAAGEGFGPFGPGAQALTSDDAGRFRFERLTPGRYTLTAALRGRNSPPVEAVVQGGQSRDDLVLELSGGRAIHGVVKGLSEAELGGVRVWANGPDEYFASARTSADGSFELAGAPTGPIALRARTGDFTSGSRGATAQVVVPEGQPEVAAEIVFEAGYRIDGHFTRAGVPVAEAHVMALSRSGGPSASDNTDASGAFALEGLGPGTYEIRAATFGQGRDTSAQKTVDVQGDLVVELEAPLGRLAGSVREAETGRPVNGATVELEAGGLRSLERTTTDSAGRFELEDVEPGRQALSVRKPSYETASRTVEVSEAGDDVTVELRRGEGIGLLVRDGTYGTPLRQVLVRVRDGSGTSLFTGGVALDSEGRGEVPGLPPGTYELRADAAAYAPVTLRGLTAPLPALALTLTAGGTLEVASGPETLGRPGSRARLIGPDGLPYFPNIFSDDGWLTLGQPLRRFESVAPGSYTLAVDGGVSRTVEVREGATSRVELP